jgi:MoaA/NifB/PqqE/SkfB family radical SAM enzyme
MVMNITKRIDLNLGYSCNLKCRFCYYRESVGSPSREVKRELTTEEARRWLRFFRRKGLEAVDFTGGEPTIRDDIFDLIGYAKELGYRTICVITNGVKLAEEQFCRKLVECGLNDILFSLHGPDSAVHDDLTGVPGSFKKLLQGMDNMRGLPIRRRSNTVVNGLNYTRLEEIARVLREKGIERANFILFNQVEEAGTSDSGINLRYRDSAPHLHNLIDQYSGSFERITVRYIPFCLMPGYEKYVTNFPQIQYDPDEWDYLWRSYFRRGALTWAAATAGGFLLHPAPRRLLKIKLRAALREAIVWSIIAVNKIKGPQCRRCRYYRICDGLWRDYADRFGFEELTSVEGSKISDPAAYLVSSPKNNIATSFK